MKRTNMLVDLMLASGGIRHPTRKLRVDQLGSGPRMPVKPKVVSNGKKKQALILQRKLKET
jgi:hypothetical protein